MPRRKKPAEVKGGATSPGALPKNQGGRVGDLEERLAEALKREAEALERQRATADILKVISSSPTDTQPVFDAIATNAARLCSANDTQVLRVDGDVLRLVAAHGTPSMPPVRPLTRGNLVGRAVIDRRTIHVRDQAQALAE